MNRVEPPSRTCTCGNLIAGADTHSVCALCLGLQHARDVLWCVHTGRGFCDRSGRFTCYPYVEVCSGAKWRGAKETEDAVRKAPRAKDELKNLNFFLNSRCVNQSGTGCGRDVG
ncbi:hypothetical protein XENOCAPTIV_017548 [Xenoophorus captivus]|uniref:Uncharacterized protein n=1 Tax=Xenoophorus captivus TaxID=1517983 RepID=A0ABV0RCR7_9TELE